MKDYSQSGEQEVILSCVPRLLPNEDTGESPRFLDIGCWDPIHFSNTRALIELGWSGILIDPSPGPIINMLRCCVQCGYTPRELEVYGDRKLRECVQCGGERYGFSKRLQIICAAVGPTPGLTTICVTDDAVSTNDNEQRERWDSVGGFYGYLTVPTLTLTDIATQFGGFDFVNIDVEGKSADLFIEMLRLGIFPPCVCVEHDSREREILAAATKEHYACVLANGTNMVLKR